MTAKEATYTNEIVFTNDQLTRKIHALTNIVDALLTHLDCDLLYRATPAGPEPYIQPKEMTAQKKSELEAVLLAAIQRHQPGKVIETEPVQAKEAPKRVRSR